jgi:hypothetical protein
MALVCRSCGLTVAETRTAVGRDSLEFTCARCLMREADRLSGARPATGTGVFAGLTKDKMLARHLIHASSQAAPGDSETRGKLEAAITLQASEIPQVRRQLKREFPRRFSITPPAIRNRGGRPKVSEGQKQAARRKASRAYRERKRGESAGE